MLDVAKATQSSVPRLTWVNTMIIGRVDSGLVLPREDQDALQKGCGQAKRACGRGKESGREGTGEGYRPIPFELNRRGRVLIWWNSFTEQSH
jgi:hypothetical protein